MKKDMKKSRRFPALTAACAAAVACLALAGVYAYAKYTTSLTSDLAAAVDPLDVTSHIEYVDAAGTVEAFDGNLGTADFPSEGGIDFEITITNHSSFAVTCFLTLNDGYSFTSVKEEGGSISGDYRTLTLSGPIEAEKDGVPGTAAVCFTVVRDDSWTGPKDAGGVYEGAGVYARELEIKLTYVQAG